ncbi:MAG TPA: phage holin family protein [Saprospiraceae bacterium]|nr:phage holin family protein [Saprospiraceae bacterium]HPG05670.1 phage holin family protein [Saprospiraceae bacterium]HRV83297.1 phage holin family protein [Saprospiraceae bacterium]
MDILDENTGRLGLDDNGMRELSESAKWARIMGIIMMVIAGLFGLFAVIGTFAMVTMMGSAGFLGFFYLLFAGIYFYMGLLLYRYSSNMDKAGSKNTAGDLTTGFQNLKNYFKINAILIIAGIVFTIIVYIIIGATMMMGGTFPLE